ncbi:recombinase family protein [Rhizomonospora bruguierae]|uniref:recombinase family protein n=1 Tax=Rhizomonospora bruguierae TaxID=1581705 RepID=UPI001BCDEA91|nr:recombinase family protein [Micromonospora sp. NBRC 107566]
MTIDIPRIEDTATALLAQHEYQRFAFYGRVSTEDQQDPVASRNWQITRATGLIEPAGGIIVAEFFDIGLSRSLPWKRRPHAARLLDALADPNRGFDAVVIGEPQRAFYGNQYSLTMPVFSHYGVGLWVPEVGGAIDPESEAHDLIMSVFGGMSKGERTRVKVRVRTAMSSQAKIEGRFLGGRPPYGYRLADAGPHPNPAKAADGRRLHKLEPDPTTAPVVRRIFAMYLANYGYFAIAEALTRDGIPSPSAADPARNPHRTGEGWAKSAVKNILSNPRYTGRQVWNKQRKDEVLLDVNDVALGYETRMRWNDKDSWVWSDTIAHPPLVTVNDFELAQTIMAAGGRGRTGNRLQKVRRHYVLRGLMLCGLCGRKMQSHQAHESAYYRCRYPNEYALANHVQHPRNVYVAERDIVPALDNWLLKAFAPHRLTDTIQRLQAAQPAAGPNSVAPAITAANKIIATCDAKLAQYRAIADAGGDPATVAAWMAEVNAQRAAAIAQRDKAAQEPAPRHLAEEDIRRLIGSFDDIRNTLRDARSEDKSNVYRELRLALTYDPGQNKISVEAKPDADYCGVTVRVRGGT